MKTLVRTLNLTIKECNLITVETYINKGMSKFIVSGNIDKTIRESRSRIISSFKYNSIKFPYGNVITNLFPANIKKTGSNYDLPITISILSKQIEFKNLSDYIICGELVVDGKLIPINNPIRIINESVKLGYKKIILPKSDINYTYLFEGINIYQADGLKEVINHLSQKKLIKNINKVNNIENSLSVDFTINEIIAQESLIRALIIAISGKHNILIKGPVGAGKTISIKSLNSLFSKLSYPKSIILSDILTRNRNENLITRYPLLVYPENNINIRNLFGNNRKLGLISEANFGFLVLDEINTFSKNILNNIKRLLDNDDIYKYGKEMCIDYPVDFSIIATMNPCPCAKLGTDEKCSCSISEITRYNNQIDNALLDRFDMKIFIDRPSFFYSTKNTYNIDDIKNNIVKAKNIQKTRYKNDFMNNGSLNSKEITQYFNLNEKLIDTIDIIVNKYKFSKRKIDNLIKVSRTIADLDEKEQIEENHLLEALKYQNF